MFYANGTTTDRPGNGDVGRGKARENKEHNIPEQTGSQGGEGGGCRELFEM